MPPDPDSPHPDTGFRSLRAESTNKRSSPPGADRLYLVSLVENRSVEPRPLGWRSGIIKCGP